MREDAKAFGIPVSAIEGTLAQIEAEKVKARKQDTVDVWPESVPTLELWNMIGHMWVYGAMGGRVCLRWESVNARISLYERNHDPVDADAITGIGVLEKTLVGAQGK